MFIVTKANFSRHMVRMMIISVIAWGAFALFFRSFWPGASAPGDNLSLLAVWFMIGGTVFIAMLFLVFRIFKTPPAWRANTALALTAPALCCDVFTVTFFESWFVGGGSADDRIYAAMLLGGVGIFQLAGLFATRQDEAS
jgi:hypothetical protein